MRKKKILSFAKRSILQLCLAQFVRLFSIRSAGFGVNIRQVWRGEGTEGSRLEAKLGVEREREIARARAREKESERERERAREP
jgi:hypothetical protein